MIWENLAEVRSLAIAKPWRGNGFSNILVDECCKDARRIGIDRVFALTYQVRFFERNGFGVVSRICCPSASGSSVRTAPVSPTVTKWR